MMIIEFINPEENPLKRVAVLWLNKSSVELRELHGKPLLLNLNRCSREMV